MPELNIQEIKKIIPHRYPMLLIDRVKQLVPGQKAVAIHNVSFNDPFVKANCRAVFPKSLIVEAMAQTGAVALLSEHQFQGKTAYFGGIDKADFFAEARPGDQIVITTKLVKIRRNIGLGQGLAVIGENIIAQAELTFMIG